MEREKCCRQSSSFTRAAPTAALATTALLRRRPCPRACRNPWRCAASGLLPPAHKPRRPKSGNVELLRGRTRHLSCARAQCLSPPGATHARVAAKVRAPKLMSPFTNFGRQARSGACIIPIAAHRPVFHRQRSCATARRP